jgi:L-aspartate oxidase
VRGEGLGLAALAGAEIADPEFVQFHPTAIDIGAIPRPWPPRPCAARARS